ncbi:hypothetical protein L484_001752 [Morus notabilis]|uniref:Late embryogenesis abundant protein LEA-2 subgroup domain-containing protein n=1 Tax=Morus notabilis TaxID=981085 RepID=W9RRD1_9ROSA|nr:NDR1/HIN1-like protein 1 [Morus notabilis]EXB66196.1 hypothetical protein L484_001752 [Morus notabilis]
MSIKHCGHHHNEEWRKLVRRILIGLATLVVILAIVILLVWAILHPSKPRFVLQDVTVYNFTASAGPPYALTAVIQATISSRNPNDRVGVYYHQLDVFPSYRGQQITAALLLPASYQGYNDVTVWSPMLLGNDVPISPYLQQLLSQDLNVGSMLVDIKIVGRVKWKVGSWVSGKYHFDVNCPAYLQLGGSTGIIPVGPAMKLQLLLRCHVETALG